LNDPHRVVPNTGDNSATEVEVERARNTLRKIRTLKLPCCARWIIVVRANHFAKVAVFAVFITVCIASVKYKLSMQAERNLALQTLENTGRTVAKALKTQVEADMAALDEIARLWRFAPTITRDEYRSYILHDYFRRSLSSLETIMLVHRVKAGQRNAYEMDADAIRVRDACCNGTTYDIPSQGKYCRDQAKEQCVISGPSMYHINALFMGNDGSKTFRPAPDDANEHLLVWYQEPLELDPKPMGIDVGSIGNRRAAFVKAEKTGMKGFTTRFLRECGNNFEFRMLVFNNVFVDKATHSNHVLKDGVPFDSKQKLIAAGKEPYAIGSVVGVYKVQMMLYTTMRGVFGAEIEQTRVYLVDDRATTPASLRFLAYYDPSLGLEQMFDEVLKMARQPSAPWESSEDVQRHAVNISGTDTSLSIVLEPNSDYFFRRISFTPFCIFLASIVIIIVAQVERWCGHPSIVSQNKLVLIALEAEIREQVLETMNDGKYQRPNGDGDDVSSVATT